MTKEQALSLTQLFEGDVNGSPFPVACFGGHATRNIRTQHSHVSAAQEYISNNKNNRHNPQVGLLGMFDSLAPWYPFGHEASRPDCF